MKRAKSTQTPTVFSIYAEDKNGLVGQLMIFFNRPNYPVISVNVARTDVSDIVLITIEAIVPDGVLIPFTERLKKVIEVFDVNISNESLKKIGFYRVKVAGVKPEFWSLLTKFGANLSGVGNDFVTIYKIGNDKDLEDLYAALEGPGLLNFCKSALINENVMQLTIN
ncbi:hypothetical protein [Mucilaginibacter sp. L196]|uniref:hypothetical protein n=1 Tax=Mucilaginibacter sp. L196 TaxID=1641870 RepID=UPI00131D25CA|nr:hypothetical protein [Mucilaginibacter sp. L196]